MVEIPAAVGVAALALLIATAVIAVHAHWRIQRLSKGLESLRERVRQGHTGAASLPRPASPRPSQLGPGFSATQPELKMAGPTSVDPPARNTSSTTPLSHEGDYASDHAGRNISSPEQVETSSELPAATAPHDPEYSDGLVRDAYAKWCNGGERPRSTTTFEVSSLRFVRTEAPAEYAGTRRHVLRDAAQIAEFVRFSPVGAAAGLALPDLDVHFTPVVAYLFPDLTRSNFRDPEAMLRLSPVAIRRRGTTDWEVE